MFSTTVITVSLLLLLTMRGKMFPNPPRNKVVLGLISFVGLMVILSALVSSAALFFGLLALAATGVAWSLSALKNKGIRDYDAIRWDIDRVTALAQSAHLSSYVGMLLAVSTQNSVKLTLAMNEKAPAEALRILAQDKESSVRQMVAMNSHTPYETLYTLASRADDEETLLVILTNKQIDEQTLGVIAAKVPAAISERMHAKETNSTKIAVSLLKSKFPEKYQNATDEQVAASFVPLSRLK